MNNKISKIEKQGVKANTSINNIISSNSNKGNASGNAGIRQLQQLGIDDSLLNLGKPKNTIITYDTNQNNKAKINLKKKTSNKKLSIRSNSKSNKRLISENKMYNRSNSTNSKKKSSKKLILHRI